MKSLKTPAFGLLLTAVLVCSGHCAVLLDDDWDDGDRTDTNLPDESAWFASVASGTPTLSAAAGSLTGNVLMFGTNTSSRLWITHFAPAGAPAQLAAGETLKITLNFTATNVSTAPGTTRGLRIGLFNFSEPGAARVTADGFSTGAGGGAPGTNVTGYMVNMNFAQTTTINNPLQIMKRTDATNINLMGATAAFTALTSGGGLSGGAAFSNGVPYVMELSVRYTGPSTQITATFSDTNGWSMTHTATDSSSPNFRFDALAIRPNSVADTADSFIFTRFKTETIPYTLRITSFQFIDNSTTRLTWDPLPGKTYEVYSRPNFNPGSSWTLLGLGGNSFDDGDAGFELERYYRVLQLP